MNEPLWTDEKIRQWLYHGPDEEWVMELGNIIYIRNQYEAALAELRTAVERLEDKITAIIAEFGDNPAECLLMIGEHISLCQHYRANPNAPREGEL